MRSVSFTWGGQAREVTPTMAFLAAMASDLARTSDGAENTLTMAHKLNAGGADPVYTSTILWHLLRAAGADLSREDAYSQLMGTEITLVEKAEFRLAYIHAVLPQVDLGKKPEAPAAKPPATKAPRKK